MATIQPMTFPNEKLRNRRYGQYLLLAAASLGIATTAYLNKKPATPHENTASPEPFTSAMIQEASSALCDRTKTKVRLRNGDIVELQPDGWTLQGISRKGRPLRDAPLVCPT